MALNEPPVNDRTKTIRQIRFLIWTYLILLIFEGALRKWVVPQLSNPLLIIRDPVVIAIFLLALRAGVFSFNRYVVSLWILGFLSVLVGMLVLEPYLPWSIILEVTIYGFRCNFLHLPLIFVMANVLDVNDVKKFGWFLLVLMLPMCLLMIVQFEASPDSFINRTVGAGEAQQLTAGSGKIRPPGTFSFVSGAIFYISVTSAFVLYGAMAKGAYKTWLLLAAGSAVLVSIAVSGSRGCVVSVLLIVMSILVIFLVKPRAVNQFGRLLLVVVLAASVISRVPILREGLDVLSARFTESAEAADTTIIKGMLHRTISGFTQGLRNLDKPPLFGYGLGIGTAGGARFLVGRAAFLLAEDEWTRVLMESGPIFGLLFLLWRVALTLRIGWTSLVALARDSLTLPVLLFGCSFLPLLNGQLGQPTTLGFAAFLNGLCLAAIRSVPVSPDTIEPEQITPEPKPLPRRSAYAARLYGSDSGADHTNGLVDR
ncbi:MAG TPA: hypothetical protein VH170_01805 [Chthoniobacterales bacterium]|nr:hypothetical protein [Chthoniobacterales bacterium]